MLSDEQIIRALRAVRFSPASERYARRAVSMNALAKAAGLPRERLHRIVNGQPISPRSRAALTRVLSCDKDGRAKP